MLAPRGLPRPVRGPSRLTSTATSAFSTKALRRTRLTPRVASQYAAGGAGGAPPPLPPRQASPAPPGPQQQQPGFQQTYQQPAYSPGQQQGYQAPPQQQQRQPGQRAPVPPRRRVGAAMPPQQFSQAGAVSQRLAAGAAQVASPARQVAALEPEAAPTSVQRLQGQYASEVVLPRSLLMNKEVITRTSAKRLGYVNELWVDPASLAVASLYLRASPSNILAPSCCHVMLASMRQISDVVLVHDERALSDPPADASLGYCRLVGALVLTQSGQELGRVRDFLFDPDNGAVSTIKYDRLGLPWLPQQLLSCYSLSWEDVVALGPTKLIVRAGAETRAIKENDGIADTGVSVLADLLVGPAGGDNAERPGQRDAAPGAAPSYGQFTEAQLASPEYRAWYQQFGRQYEAAYRVMVPPPLEVPGAAPQQQREAPPPRALPPPRSTFFAQAVQQQQQQQQPQYQQVLQQQQQVVPAGGGRGGDGWAAPRQPQQPQQFAFPPQEQGGPQGGQYRQAPPPSQQGQQYRQGPAAAGQQRPAQQQGGRPSQPQGRPAGQGGQRAPPLPQNGIPIIDRTPPPPHRRRDFDGNYGTAPPASQARQAQQPGPAQQRPQAAAAAQPGGAQAQAAQPRPRVQQQQQRAPVVEPDAVIPGGLRPPGAGGGSLGTTGIAEYRQL